MSVSAAHLLTAQFYSWEWKLRGWHKAEFPADLEPPFEPFVAHTLPETGIIDDGLRPSLFQSWFGSNKKSEPIPEPIPDILAFEDKDDSPLHLFALSFPKHRSGLASAMEQLLTILSYRSSPISFEIIGTPSAIHVQLTCREPDFHYLTTQFKAYLPECGIVESTIDQIEAVIQSDTCLYTMDFGLEEECMRPIAMLNNDREPYTALFGMMERLESNEYIVAQVLFSGVQNPWAESLLTASYDNFKKGSFFADDSSMPSAAQQKVSRPLFAATIRTVTAAPTLAHAHDLLLSVMTALTHASKSTTNTLIPLPDAEYSATERITDILLRQSHRVGMLLNSQELCTLVHLPGTVLSKLPKHVTTKAAPPAVQGHAYGLGENLHQGVETPVGLSAEQRLRHIHIIGATGTGKSTLLHSLISQDIEEGNGVMVLDPHGDLITAILKAIPEKRISDVVLIDPADRDHTVPFNILSAHSEQEKELLSSDLVALFKRFSTSWGDQLHSVFSNAVLAFLYNSKQGTLADLRRFLIEPEFRANIIATVTDADIVYYWHKEYPLLKTSSIGSIITRLDSFLRPRVIRNMVSQPGSLDLAECMDSKKIVLVKLSQGLLGTENSYLLGAFLVSKLQQIAMSRQSQESSNRVPFYCYVDEFHHFVTPSMASILSGARKYGVGLILAHQDLGQCDSDILNSLLANAGTRICFRLGDSDAKKMQEGFSAFSAEDLQNLATGEAIVRVATRDQDFSLAVLPFENPPDDYTAQIIEQSQNNYAVAISAIPVDVPSPTRVPVAPIIPIVDTQPSPIESAPRTSTTHRYLQTFIKKLAEDYGYIAKVEVPTPDGAGLVDVLLEKDGISIAVEVSVTTPAQWELHNVSKCLAAGYSQVIVCTDQPLKARQLTDRLTALPPTDRQKVRIITSADIPALFANDTKPQPADTIMKGYRVKVNYEQQASRQDLLRNIVKAGKR